MAKYRRMCHVQAHAALSAMNAEFLRDAECYFAGGTRVSMELNEYRESNDIDFLCSSPLGWRILRQATNSRSLGHIFSDAPELAREVRADRYGIRTALLIEGQAIKFEILSSDQEGLRPEDIQGIPVPALAKSDVAAQKFMANASRGADRRSNSKDLVDLAFIAASWPAHHIGEGLDVAERQYGHWVASGLKAALALFAEDHGHRRRSLESMDVNTEDGRLLRGIEKLNRLVGDPIDMQPLKDQFEASACTKRTPASSPSRRSGPGPS